MPRDRGATAHTARAAEVERQLDFLAVTLRNAINTLNPSKVVLGSFLSSLYAIAPGHLDGHVAEMAFESVLDDAVVTLSRHQP